MSLLSIVISLIMLASLVGVGFFMVNGEAIRHAIGNDKIFESTYQFLLVTVIGGSTAFLYKELDYRRAQRVVLREMHAELLNAFNHAKAVRRHLRAHLSTVSG